MRGACTLLARQRRQLEASAHELVSPHKYHSHPSTLLLALSPHNCTVYTRIYKYIPRLNTKTTWPYNQVKTSSQCSNLHPSSERSPNLPSPDLVLEPCLPKSRATLATSTSPPVSAGYRTTSSSKRERERGYGRRTGRNGWISLQGS